MFIDMALRSVSWTFAKKPLRRYNSPVEGQHAAPIERPLSIPNVLVDALDLTCNLRGIGWSWSHRPFPSISTRSTSIPVILAKLLFKLVVFDASQYLVQYLRPSVDVPAGDTLFDPTLNMVPRCAWAALYTLFEGVVVFVTMDVAYHMSTLVGRILLRQSAWQWPPIFNRPWMSTSITELWGFRWHQMFRYLFVTFGSRPGGALLGRVGALMGAFAMSGVVHDLGMWGFGRGTEFSTVGGFFLLMGVGAALEHGFKFVTGRRVGGLWGWTWTMAWTICWGTMMIDAWARRGIIATDYLFGLRPGKLLVDAVISLLRRESDIHLSINVDQSGS
jgi:Membrane bound O-acyl transferase family